MLRFLIGREQDSGLHVTDMEVAVCYWNDNDIKNNRKSARINVTLRRVRITFVSMENQEVLRTVHVCL
jgi:hypothetical protein